VDKLARLKELQQQKGQVLAEISLITEEIYAELKADKKTRKRKEKP
jgi:hypothetical protein